jgi:hypothetical protein
MTHCTKPACKLSAWRKRLCFTHWRESQGFVFDRTRKVFVKAKAAASETAAAPETCEPRTAKAA